LLTLDVAEEVVEVVVEVVVLADLEMGSSSSKSSSSSVDEPRSVESAYIPSLPSTILVASIVVVEVEVVVVEEVVVEEVVVVVEEVVVEEVVVEEVVDVVVVLGLVLVVEVVLESTTKPLPNSEGVDNTSLSGFSTGFAAFRDNLFLALAGIAEHKSTRESATHTKQAHTQTNRTNRHFLSLFVIFVVKIIFLRT
jgi:hypothetical protein